jgi:hypothetical protein
MAVVEEKTMVPTVLVGIGGTGTEVLARVRRLVEETYGDLKNFPILSFLIVDTDRDYKVTNPLAAGSPFKDSEKLWASVSGNQVKDMVTDLGNYPWIDSWFPRELERNIQALEAGAGQIRACGRFAFFCNYPDIRKKFNQACDRVKGRENFMLDRYDIKVSNSQMNVFVTGSLSGGTGSGMLIDIGYAIRHWLRGQGSPMITAIVPLPAAFSGIDVGDRVLANGYAAMMELSYFSDNRTEYIAQFSSSLTDEVRSINSPFDFTYLVGTKNGENDFTLEQIREMIAQNIFLDLTSDFAPHKRSIRDNIKSAWAAKDPGGRGYPKNFMSFGLSTVEIPIALIRTSLSNRLATDLVKWWLNDTIQLPPQLMELTHSILKGMRLTDAELLADLGAAGDKPYTAEIASWVNGIRNHIAAENLLQCTYQGINALGQESGKILEFVDVYLKPKVDEYFSDHLRELSPDERLHGDFLQKMYDNRNQIIRQGRKAIEEEFYRILEDRTRGPKFASSFILTLRQALDNMAEKFRRDREKIWQPNEVNRRLQYEQALQDITYHKGIFGISKQAKMEEFCAAALTGLEGALVATVNRKTCTLGLEVIDRLKEHLQSLEQHYNRLIQRLNQTRDFFKLRADQQADSADTLEMNGIKLFVRRELNDLYQDLIEQQTGASEGNKSRYELGLESVCSILSNDVLEQASPLWKETRAADEVMRLFDLPNLSTVQEPDFREIIFEKTKAVIQAAPENSKLRRDLAACDRIFRVYNNDEPEITNNLRIAYNKSKPLILLSRAVLTGKDAGFTAASNTKVAIIGGRNTADPAAQKIIPLIEEFVPGQDAITPLGNAERHRIVCVQETGGFSLRCIEGMTQLRQSYQDWRGEMIIAKRARLRGENRDMPIPVHIEKEPRFWDIFPENPEVFKTVVLGRAFGMLRLEENRATKEHVVRYVHATEIGLETVDIASNWEDTVQVLDVLACRDDREEIERQIAAKLADVDSDRAKHDLFEQLLNYLQERDRELEKMGGKDSPEYKREAQVILKTIQKYHLRTALAQDVEDPLPMTEDSLGDESIEEASTQDTQATINLEQLKELASLKESGLLTEEEFQAAKRKVLGL